MKALHFIFLVFLLADAKVLIRFHLEENVIHSNERTSRITEQIGTGKETGKKRAIFSTQNQVKLPRSKAPPFAECATDAFPPKKENLIEKYVIDLDLPPKGRWTSLILSKKKQLKVLSDYMEDLMVTLLGPRVFKFINESLPGLAQTLPAPYPEEIAGIAEAGDLSMSEATLYNIFYEVFTVCTSIIAQGEGGRPLHARNLDFGLFLGWDSENHTWLVSELLRPLVVRLEWRKGGRTLYESVSYAGFVGVVTAVKKERFSFSLDERFSVNGGYVGLLEWIIFKNYNQRWVSFLVRDVMESAESFEDAVQLLSTPPLLAPVYFIVGGVLPGQGVIISRFRNAADVLRLGAAASPVAQASWFLVETNYDHWKAPPFFDDRRTPAIACLGRRGPANLTLGDLFNVLSTRPVLNKLTTYTTLMDTNQGYMETWLRDCPDPCWPW